MKTRREFIKLSSAISLAFAGRMLLGQDKHHYSLGAGYGPLIADPAGVLDLPKGFAYKVISKSGEKMDDGLYLPGQPDGMAAFQEGDLTILLRNHELYHDSRGPYGKDLARTKKLIPNEKIYDACDDGNACCGGVSKIVYDTKNQKVISQSLALTGTVMNCAGGTTPWGSWVTCEETMVRVGESAKIKNKFSKDHGYNFEVKASTNIELADPVPLKEMGRFKHEAVSVDPRTGIVYQSEDQGNGLLYRFLPNVKGELSKGGKLQALVVDGHHRMDTRNWDPKQPKLVVGEKYKTKWIDINNVESPKDDLRHQGAHKGAAMFGRGEGLFFGENELFLNCTAGGSSKTGQIFKYVPAKDEAEGASRDIGGVLELYFEPDDPKVMKSSDNLTISPWGGDLYMCEDHGGDIVRLLGLTPSNELYVFAGNHLKTSFSGVTFSPDASTLFVNIMGRGFTVAVTGPWKK